MNRMKTNFDISFAAEEAPFFQVRKEQKVSIPFDLFKHEPLLAKETVSLLFKDSGEIDVSFLKSYSPNGKASSFRFMNKSLHRTINIRNWETHVQKTEEFEDLSRYVTIKNIEWREVYNYFLALLRGKRNSYIGFYNNYFFMQVDHDEVIIIVRDENMLAPVKELLENLGGDWSSAFSKRI